MSASAARRPRRRAFRPSDAVDYDRHADTGSGEIIDDRMVILDPESDEEEEIAERDVNFYLEQKPPHY